MDELRRGDLQLWGHRPHFLKRLPPFGYQFFQLWGHCPHNLRIKAVKAEIAIELTTVAIADLEFHQALRKFGEEAVP